MKISEDITGKVTELFSHNGWVRWIHDGTKPAYTMAEKNANVEYAESIGNKHCAQCMNINGCLFPEYNMPQKPLHPNCHCRTVATKDIAFSSNCLLAKFSGYIFDEFKSDNKKALFESWGYAIMDSEWLKHEYERQAKEKYEAGDFSLGKLNEYGQRITIEIVIPRKNSPGFVIIKSGWMVYPNGNIMLNTPYAGGENERIKLR